MAQNVAAFGLYLSTRSLYFGAEALRAAKFRHTDISVMYSDGRRAFGMRESDVFAEEGIADLEPHETTLPGLLTSLSGIGAVMMSSDGPFMAGGPILASVTGGETLMSSLRGLGLPESELDSFEARLREGGLLLSVQCDDDRWAARARTILQETGAERVAATA